MKGTRKTPFISLCLHELSTMLLPAVSVFSNPFVVRDTDDFKELTSSTEQPRYPAFRPSFPAAEAL
jgi:hypothetical protein